MKTVGLFEAKTRLSEICEDVSKSGKGVTVTRRGKPLVRIEPVREPPKTIRERRAEYMEKHGDREEIEAKDFEPPKRSAEIRSFNVDG
jgi:prevent-host-death family protein